MLLPLLIPSSFLAVDQDVGLRSLFGLFSAPKNQHNNPPHSTEVGLPNSSLRLAGLRFWHFAIIQPRGGRDPDVGYLKVPRDFSTSCLKTKMYLAPGIRGCDKRLRDAETQGTERDGLRLDRVVLVLMLMLMCVHELHDTPTSILAQEARVARTR